MPNYYLRRGSDFFYLGSLAALVASSLYCTCRITKYFLRQKTDPMCDFNVMINDAGEKSLLGLSSAATLYTTSLFLLEANRMV